MRPFSPVLVMKTLPVLRDSFAKSSFWENGMAEEKKRKKKKPPKIYIWWGGGRGRLEVHRGVAARVVHFHTCVAKEQHTSLQTVTNKCRPMCCASLGVGSRAWVLSAGYLGGGGLVKPQSTGMSRQKKTVALLHAAAIRPHLSCKTAPDIIVQELPC